jgi:hypothetical protein
MNILKTSLGSWFLIYVTGKMGRFNQGALQFRE